MCNCMHFFCCSAAYRGTDCKGIITSVLVMLKFVIVQSSVVINVFGHAVGTALHTYTYIQWVIAPLKLAVPKSFFEG